MKKLILHVPRELNILLLYNCVNKLYYFNLLILHTVSNNPLCSLSWADEIPF